VLEGTQHFVAYQCVELGRALLQAALCVIVVLNGWGIAGLGGALAASSLAALLAYWVLAHRAVAGLKASPFRASRAELGRLVRFGGGVFTLRLLSTVYNQMDRAIVGVALGPRPVGLYEIANKVNLGVATIGSVSVSAVVPAAAALRREAALLRDMFVRGSCYATAASLPFAVAAFIFAKPLLLSWIGPSARPAIGAVRLFAAYEAMQMVNNVGSTMIYGLGRIRLPLIVNTAATLLNLALSIALVHPLGFSGVIVGTLLANGLAWPVLLWFYLKVFDCPLRMWSRRLVGPNLPGLAMQIGVSLVLYEAIGAHTRSLAVAISLFLVSVGVSLLTFVALGVRGEDRRAFLDTLRRAMGRPPQGATA
jgi:O-antigen/teichoic acid export membrane protein